MSMDDLVVWLRQQLDLDQGWAMSCSQVLGEAPKPWRAGVVFRTVFEEDGAGVANTRSQNYAEHIALHDPARVLRDVEAKRRILDEHPRCSSHDHDRYRCDACTTCGDGSIWPCATIKLLALPYSERPGYREEEWKP